MFCFLPVKPLSSERVVLVPFEVDKHAQALWTAFAPHPSLFTYLYGPFPTLFSLLDWHTSYFANNPSAILYLIHVIDPNDPSGSPALAGTVGYLNASTATASAEIGFITLLPCFQRMGLAKHAAALLLHQALDLPSEGGWGLRRLQWQTHAENVASINLAQQMGFTLEGILRWQRILPHGKLGKVTDEERLKLRRGEGAPGRNTAMLSVCWDEWETGIREAVKKRMETNLKS